MPCRHTKVSLILVKKPGLAACDCGPGRKEAVTGRPPELAAYSVQDPSHGVVLATSWVGFPVPVNLI